MKDFVLGSDEFLIRGRINGRELSTFGGFVSDIVATNSLLSTIVNQLSSVDNLSTIAHLLPQSSFFGKRDIVPFC